MFGNISHKETSILVEPEACNCAEYIFIQKYFSMISLNVSEHFLIKLLWEAASF